MVSGLVIHTSTTASATLQRSMIAAAAAMSICSGSGMKATNTPTNIAVDTE